MRREVPTWLERGAAVGWRLLVIGAAVYYGALTIAGLRIVTVPLLLALFVAALLRPAARLGERFMPASLAAFATVSLSLLVLGGALTLLGFGIAGQVQQAADSAARGWRQFVDILARSPLTGSGDASELLSTAADELQSRAGGLASQVAAGAETVVTFVSQLLLTLVFSFFFVRDGQRIFDYLVTRLSEKSEHKARRVGDRAWSTLGRYLRGLALIALFNSLLKGLALVLIGVPLVVPIMILTFIGSFIPFAGPIIAGSVATLIALADSGWTAALWVVGAALCIQAIEGNVLQPYVLGRTMSLHPVLILAGVTAGAILAGLAGAFLAVPVLAVVVNSFPAVRSEPDAA